MRAQRDPAESDQEHCRGGAENADKPRTARRQRRQNKKQELAVKQRGSNRVAAGKTVAGPIHKLPVDEWPLPLNKNLEPLVIGVKVRRFFL